MNNDLVTIKTSNIPGELSVAQSFLEENGIYCFLKDELTFQVQPYAIGGVKLQVREEDALMARQLLVEGGFAKKEDFEIPKSTLKMVKVYEKISSFFKKKK